MRYEPQNNKYKGSNPDSVFVKQYKEFRYFDVEAYYKKFATLGYDSIEDDLYYYYHNFLPHKSYEERLEAVANMKIAAKRYKNKEMEFEAEYMRAFYLPASNETELRYKIKQVEIYIEKAIKKKDIRAQIKAVRFIYLHCLDLGYYAIAFRYAKKTVDLLNTITDEQYNERRQTYFLAGRGYYKFKDFDKAIWCFKTCLEDTTLRGFRDGTKLDSKNRLGYYYSSKNMLDTSDYYYHSAFFSSDFVRNRPYHDMCAVCGLAWNNIKRNEYDKAIILFDRCMAISKEGIFNDLLLRSAVGLGECYLAKNELQKTKKYIDSAYHYMQIYTAGYKTIYTTAREDLKYIGNQILYPLVSKYYSAIGNLEESKKYLDSTIMNIADYEALINSSIVLRAEQQLYEQQILESENQKSYYFNMLIMSVLFIIICLITLGILIHFYRIQKEAYKQLSQKAVEWANIPNNITINKEEINTNTENKDVELIMQKIYQLFADEHLYRDNNLTLDSLAEKLGIHRNRLSKAINSLSNNNFNNFINEYRIKDAIKILSANIFYNYSIDDLIMSTGFNSRASFYTAFKKFTGLTPSEFKKSLRNQKSIQS